MSDTFRTDMAAGLVTMMEAFRTANTTLLAEVLASKPESFNRPLPVAYVSGRPESVTYDQGTRERVMSPSITVVGPAQTNALSMARFDALVDALHDHFATYAHITPGTIWDRMTVEDDREDIGDGSSLPSVRFTFLNISKRVGRTALT